MATLIREGVKYSGVEIEIGAKKYIVPALSLGQIRDHKEVISKVRSVQPGDSDTDRLQLMVEALPLIKAALSRNYSDVTLEQLENDVDVNNFRQIIESIFGVSGLRVVQSAPGETRADATAASESAHPLKP